ncbi:Dos2-interacting transcription regulator of RNA-Pol-II-domain-containing protein [Gilbertella persicaria]|uniref:Dos2-interacting transcription regulator of RNA-Pol-II-domain-containing protein n=1 Tax=Gilbertella persicaria TaxID=101096 RepID=UPI0022211755|nr:Dos2-interacting transcription regulator of RNA-Pol-II-domain-containing protein [Gilbertella persicaria]KAI8092187.1 Dos2-interacting transcription regulator of RNA-Pol-II-domain-containing protein [Gilbertella persicaria]
MSLLEKEVTKYMITADNSSAEAIEAVRNLVTIVNQGSVQDKLLQLIQTMGEYLTNDDEFVRAKATGLLSSTLTDCKQEDINESAASVLVDFYCERLTDKTCVQNLLDGLVALTGYSNFTDKNAVFVSKRIFQHVPVQQFPQHTRNSAFKVFHQLIQRHVNALKSINNEFVYGFTQILDGEKDPRNLMCAFQIMKNIVYHFDISSHVEDIFEVTFCYFPITFKPPPDDPYGITADDLKVSLRECISSTPYFAKFALPLILEKLSSTSGSAKKDSMETLAACAPVYGASAILPHITEIFNCLKLEVFHAIDAPLEDAAVESIRAVVSALNSGLTTSEGDPTEKALEPLIEECATNLKDPDMKDSKQTGRILKAAASASPPACHYVVDHTAPLVLKQYRETSVATLKKANVDIMIDLLEACKFLTSNIKDYESPLLEYKDRFFGIFESCLIASNEYNLLRLSGLRGLQLMILSEGYLEVNEVGLAIQSINQILLNEQDQELRSAALGALEATCQIHSKYIIELTLPALIQQLPDTMTNENCIDILYAFKVLAPVPAVYPHAMPLLTEKFDKVCENDHTPSYALAMIDTMLHIFKTKAAQKHTDLAEGVNTFVPHFVKKAVEASLGQSSLILSPHILEKVALIIITIFSKADASAQKSFVDKMFRLFVNGQLPEIGVTQTTLFNPLDGTCTSNEQKETCRLFSAIVCSLRRDVQLPISSLEDYLNELVTLALSASRQVQVTCASRIIGSCVNKWKNNAALTEYVKSTALVLEDVITQKTDNSKHALEVYLWITKALVLCTHPLGYELTNKLIEWCGDNTAGLQAPQGFHVVIGEDELALTKTTFAITTILYKQRFFSFCLPKLLEGFRSTQDDTIKPNYLIALSHVLRNVPKQILLSELPPLVPLLIESLALEDGELKVSTLDTFSLAVEEASDVIAPQIRTILPSLLALLGPDLQNSIRVRVAALACLAKFPMFVAKDALLPHVQFVIRQLKTPLDDKKRVVRKEAVDCRSKWFTITA